jgi:hypothetical protein
MDTVSDEGWIKLHRRIGRSAVFQNEGLLKVWIWCLIRANHKEEWVPISTGRGTTQVLVKRGQFIFGRKSAAKALKMDESTAYKRMQKLESMENLNIQSNTHYSLVNILNYELYQGYQNDEVTGKVTPKEQPSNTNKNDKNEKNNIGSSPKKTGDPRVKGFFDYWSQAFLKNIGKGYVFSYEKDGKLAKDLLKVHDLPTLQDATKRFFRDEQCKRRGFTIGIFFQEINRLLSQRAMSPLEQAKRELRARGSDKG